MPRQPRTRERLLDAALDLFVEEGFSGTTITEIERRVGLTPGTGSFYRHFRSKEELLAVTVEREVERAMAEIAEARSGPPPADPVEGLRLALRDIRRFDRLLRLALVDGDRVPEVRGALTAALQASGEQLSWADDPATVVRLAALGGYHVLSLVQGRPFQGAPEDEFLAVLSELSPTP